MKRLLWKKTAAWPHHIKRLLLQLWKGCYKNTAAWPHHIKRLLLQLWKGCYKKVCCMLTPQLQMAYKKRSFSMSFKKWAFQKVKSYKQGGCQRFHPTYPPRHLCLLHQLIHVFAYYISSSTSLPTTSAPQHLCLLHQLLHIFAYYISSSTSLPTTSAPRRLCLLHQLLAPTTVGNIFYRTFLITPRINIVFCRVGWLR